VLIANRGAVARRVVRACHALGVEAVVVYSDADAGAPYLAEADRVLPLAGVRAGETYLNQQALIDCLISSGADAVHPGYGFLAENAAFARAVAATGAVFVGPDPRWLEAFGDKTRARTLMARQGFPVGPGSAAFEGPRAALEAAAALGYPLLVKPVAGGGGLGMARVTDPSELPAAVRRAAATAAASFGDGRVYLERWLEGARHIEFQVLGDGRGNALYLGERDCSSQRRQQKVVEEAPAPGMDAAWLAHLGEQAARALGQLDYGGLATVETLVSAGPEAQFLEVNPRLQVEHGVTEAITGVDLVAAQLREAASRGDPAAASALPAAGPIRGHAVEARIYAEDDAGRPSTGRLRRFEAPALDGVRVDTGYAAGQWVTPWYDPLLAKVIAHGDSRARAIGRLQVALRAFVIEGVASNRPLLARLLGHDDFLAARVDVGWLERRLRPST